MHKTHGFIPGVLSERRYYIVSKGRWILFVCLHQFEAVFLLARVGENLYLIGTCWNLGQVPTALMVKRVGSVISRFLKLFVVQNIDRISTSWREYSIKSHSEINTSYCTTIEPVSEKVR